MITVRDIEYSASPYGHIATIPAGTKVERAHNLPGNHFWALPWKGMTRKAYDWFKGYGFLLEASDVTGQ
ncbi:MAG: hypothetical protein EA417_23160 [Gammaproteobacteria bacterium]|nr:MAG: hypothetical protein EA417_23160 [Gammaproteobacteria bacterium]